MSLITFLCLDKVNAAFEVARREGEENINARTVARELDCSTQPVMYHFATIEELKIEMLIGLAIISAGILIFVKSFIWKKNMVW